MGAKYLVIGVVVGVLLSSAVVALAGSMDPSSGPTDAASQMVTLEQVYDRLNDGTAGTKMTSFTEPAGGPGTGTMHSLDEIMGIAPAADKTSGALPAEVLKGKTYWGLSSGAWGPQVGTAAAASVPKTGQATPYSGGDDGEYQKGAAWPNPRFTDNSDGTVTDNLTGLIWLKDANCFGKRSWATALTDANKLNNGECSLSDGSVEGDWRLPNVREMQSLIHYGFWDPAVPNTAGTGKWTAGAPFSGVQSDYYWSSTTYPSWTSIAWRVFLSDGHVFYEDKTVACHVWPVRDEQ